MTSSAGNQAIAQWIKEQFIQMNLEVMQGMSDNVIAYRSEENEKHALTLSAHFNGSGVCDSVMPSTYDNASGLTTSLQTAS